MTVTEPISPREKRQAWRRLFFRVRVLFLLALLLGVILYAWNDLRRRRARNAWDHTLEVAIVVVRMGNVDPDAFGAMVDRLPMVTARLDEQFHRYRPGVMKPFSFTLAGPVDMPASPPMVEGEGLWDAARYAFRLWRYTRNVDARAHINHGDFDTTIYLVAYPPERRDRQLVEGSSQQRGRIGTVRVELNRTMVDFAFFVAVHELMHTLGANDKYTKFGRTSYPAGLAEPNLEPVYPQRWADVMARNRPLSEWEEATPDSLEELGVGPATAAEIGWIRPVSGDEPGKVAGEGSTF